MGLYKAGESFGFIEKTENGKELNQEKFFQWVGKVNEKAPDGWKNIKELATELNMSYSRLYQIINEEKIEQKKIGAKGVIYVDSETIKKSITNRREIQVLFSIF